MPFLFSLYLCNFYAKMKLVVIATILSFCQSDILAEKKDLSLFNIFNN